jgi:hypothetical protein
MNTSRFAVILALDVVSIVILAYALYRPRHHRHDLMFSWMALNAGTFATVSLLAVGPSNMGLGLGLFGILSIVRLRSGELAQEEVGYCFIALTLALVNGLSQDHWQIAATLDVLLLSVVALVDRHRARTRTGCRAVVLDTVHPNRDALIQDLTHRLGAPVLRVTVSEVDYVRETTVCEVTVREDEDSDSLVDRTLQRIGLYGRELVAKAAHSSTPVIPAQAVQVRQPQ